MRGFGTGLKLATLQVRPTDALMLFRISGWPIFGFLEARLTHRRQCLHVIATNLSYIGFCANRLVHQQASSSHSDGWFFRVIEQDGRFCCGGCCPEGELAVQVAAQRDRAASCDVRSHDRRSGICRQFVCTIRWSFAFCRECSWTVCGRECPRTNAIGAKRCARPKYAAAAYRGADVCPALDAARIKKIEARRPRALYSSKRRV